MINFTGEIRTLYEIENQKKCYDFLLGKLVAKDRITKDLILQIHKQFTQGTYDETRWKKGERPGKFKINNYCVADGQGAVPEEVPDEIEELCDELRDIADKGENILRAAAYVHCKFENIHPFADGNGRVGRTLMNYFLITHDHQPIIVFNETKDIYYEALGHYDQTGDVLKFTDYIKLEIERSWSNNRAPIHSLASFLDV